MIKELYHKYQTSNLLKTGSKYSLASTFNSFSKMFVGLLIMRWLNPYDLGLWNAVSIFQAYIPFFLLGIQNGLSLELPILLGSKDTSSSSYISSARWFSYFAASVFFVIGFIISLVVYIFHNNINLALGILTISIIAFGVSLNQHLIATFRSSKSFDKLTNLYIVEGIIALFASVLIYKFQYYGILTYNIVIVLQHTILLLFFSPYKNVKAKFSLFFLKKLTVRGLVVMTFFQLRVFAQSVPKWIILNYGGIIKLGIYTPAIAIKGMMNILPNQVTQFLQPQMGYKYGKEKNASALWPYIRKMIFIYPLISSPVCIVLFATIPWLMENVFPKYIESIIPMRIMAIAFIFSSYYASHSILYTIKAYKQAYIFSAVELLGYLLFPMMMILIFDFDVLISVTIGILVNYSMLYFYNYFLLKKVLFLPQYNANK